MSQFGEGSAYFGNGRFESCVSLMVSSHTSDSNRGAQFEGFDLRGAGYGYFDC